ncbi:MAG: DUF4350 domain-containing protein [Planctomycetota bacterium]
MPSPRSAITIAVLLFVVVIATATLSTLAPPDSGGVGRDSYGVEAHGYRGLFDTLAALGIPAVRQLAPPSPQVPGSTFVLLGPSRTILGYNSTYLTSLRPWVEQGGRLVVAATPKNWQVQSDAGDDSGKSPTRQRGPEDNPVVRPMMLPEILGLDGVVIEDRGSSLPGATPPDDDSSLIARGRRAVEEGLAGAGERKIWLSDVVSSGNWLSLSAEVRQIALPVDRRCAIVITPPASGLPALKPVATLCTTGAGGAAAETPAGTSADGRMIAGEFAVGKGSIVVIADPSFLANRYLGEADNAVAAVRIVAPRGERVVIDEFFHGLGPRGNSLSLLTRPGYAVLALGLLGAVLLTVWREGTRLGPPIADRPVSRRGIGEYLDAMGHLLSRGRRDRAGIVREVRDGVLRELNVRVGLPPEHVDLDQLQGKLARRDPIRARHVVDTIRAVDRDVGRSDWSTSHTLNTIRRLTACL